MKTGVGSGGRNVDKVTIGNATLYHGDCLEILPALGKVDAVITDPPYGIGFGKFNRTNRNNRGERFKADKYHNGDWDDSFDLSQHIEAIKSASEEVIVWGGNYFPCLWAQPVKGIIFWNKHQPCKNFSQWELAWSNIDTPARYIDFPYYGNVEGGTKASEKEHPTQKPVMVMEKCIGLLKQEGQTILDPFMGSGTTGVACMNLGRKFIGIEIEEKYFNIACERIEQAQKQGRLFE